MIPWIHSRQLLTIFSLFFTTSIPIAALELTDAQIDVVSMRLTESAKLSWELGTRTQTILERNATSYSVFSKQRLPPSSKPDGATLSALQPLFDIASDVVSSQPKNRTGPQSLMPDGSAADPASLGVSVLIASVANGGGSEGLDYAGAAKSQIDYLFTSVPKTKDGALSHRVEEVQLWSDFIYMVPPFVAYYGVITRNRTMVYEAYNQIRLYRSHLRDAGRGMWKHIVFGKSGGDPGFWSTGNGWAAAGMLRVYATIQYSEYAPSLKHELRDLASWVHEIHTGMYHNLDNMNIFANYAGSPATSSGNFYDAASTALLASTVYRAAQILGQTTFLPSAEKSRQALSAPNLTLNYQSTSLFPSYAHFTTDGVLVPVVDPYSVGVKATGVSPEAQAFVVQMHQAWKDWKKASTNSGGRHVSLFGKASSILFGFLIWRLVCVFV